METNTRFAEELKLDYPILSDPDQKVAKAYGLIKDRPVPSRTTFFVDKEGTIVHIEYKVNVKEHGADIVKKLRELKFEQSKSKTTT